MLNKEHLTPTTLCIAPAIVSSFTSDLLSLPICKMSQDSEDLWRMFHYVRDKVLPKHNLNSRLIDQLTQEFLELYERITKKEVELKEKGHHFTQKAFYYLTRLSGESSKVSRRLSKEMRKTSLAKLGTNGDIYKI